MKKIHLFPTLILIVAVVLTLLPFLKPGLFDVHDPTSAFRLYTLVDTIKAGQFPAAWNNSLNFGYGYPLHQYYAPLFGYLGALVLPIFGSYEVAIKVALLIASLVGIFGVYNLLLSFGIYPSVLGAIAFTFLPYRASALYVRGSYAEFLAMSLLPWVIYFWSKPQKNTKNILSTAIITALFILSHNTLLILVVPIIFLAIILFQKNNILQSILTFSLSLGLASWFILPIIFERNFVQADTIAKLVNFHDHFLVISQLWYSPWRYGGSAIGVINDNMSFMIGKGQVILSIFGITLLVIKRQWKNLLIFGLMLLFGVFLSLNYSNFIWELFPILAVMQFPWRSLAIVGVGISSLSGMGILLFPKSFQLALSMVFIFLIVYTNLGYFRPQEYRNYDENILSNKSNLDPLARDKFPEYLPAWMPVFPVSRLEDGFTRTAVSVHGNVNMLDAAPLEISTAYMPQWQLVVDGKQLPIRPLSTGAIISDPVPAGLHSLELTWHRTTIENVGLIISAISLFLVIGLLVI